MKLVKIITVMVFGSCVTSYAQQKTQIKIDSIRMGHVDWGCLCCADFNNSAFNNSKALSSFYYHIEDSTLQNDEFVAVIGKDIQYILETGVKLDDTVCLLPIFKRMDQNANHKYEENCRPVPYHVANRFYCHEMSIFYFLSLAYEMLINRRLQIKNSETITYLKLVDKSEPNRRLTNLDYSRVLNIYRKYFSIPRNNQNINILKKTRYEWLLRVD